MIAILSAKLHRATVTETNIDYEGSITISQRLLSAAGILEYQKVLVVNINNGKRFETYAIASKKENVICVNGAGARLVMTNDKVIIMAFEYLEKKEISSHIPVIIKLGENNMILETTDSIHDRK